VGKERQKKEPRMPGPVRILIQENPREQPREVMRIDEQGQIRWLDASPQEWDRWVQAIMDRVGTVLSDAWAKEMAQGGVNENKMI